MSCVIVCVHVYACVCAWQMVAHVCFIALAAKGLRLGKGSERERERETTLVYSIVCKECVPSSFVFQELFVNMASHCVNGNFCSH